jgi:hypothetical protein
MTKQITKITTTQAKQIPEHVKSWISVGLSTEPANFEVATEAALELYKLCGLKPPQVILRAGSPYAACLEGVKTLKQLGKRKTNSQVQSQVQSQVESQVWSQVRSQVWSQVESQVESQVWSQVWSQVQSQVWSQVGSQVWSQVRSQVESQVKDSYYNLYGGAFWTGWCAVISFYRDVLKLESPVLANFQYFETLTKSCGYVWWHEDVLVISDRPQVIRRDQNNRLHSTVGASIVYRDGWELYYVHGVAVPKDWITQKEKLSPETALTWKNVEQRRVAAELIGWDRVLAQVKSRSLGKDDCGELLEVDLPDAPGSRIVKVVCGTGRTFCLPVPNSMQTAREAVAWSYDLKAEEYVPEVRT